MGVSQFVGFHGGWEEQDPQGEVRGAKTVVVSISVEGASSSFHVGRIKGASVCRQLPVASSLA